MPSTFVLMPNACTISFQRCWVWLKSQLFAVCPNMLTANSTPVLHELTVTKEGEHKVYYEHLYKSEE
jgi:hypothetical protein